MVGKSLKMLLVSILCASCGTNEPNIAELHGKASGSTAAISALSAKKTAILPSRQSDLAIDSGTVNVKFFTYFNPSIKEFLDGKTRVESILKAFADYGFETNIIELEVGISPREIPLGSGKTTPVLKIAPDRLVISVTAKNEEIEGGLIQYFNFQSSHQEVTFFAYGGLSIAEFRAGMGKIEDVFSSFAQNGLNLVLPSNFRVGISLREIKLGNGKTSPVLEITDGLLISITATAEEIERVLMKYVQLSQST